MFWVRSLFALTIFWFWFSAQGKTRETWKIITLDWPPYTNELSKDNGVAAEVLAKVLDTVDVDVDFVFMPWSRGVYEAQKAGYVGLFPVWKNENGAGRVISPELFSSPVGFVYSKKHPHPWKTLNDFKGLNIGIVQNYGYPHKLFELAEKGVFHLQEVSSDEQNLRKVAFDRLDVTIVDLVNAKYIVDRRLPELKNLLIFDEKVYSQEGLYLSFLNSPQAADHLRKLKQGLKNLSLQKLLKQKLETASMSVSD